MNKNQKIIGITVTFIILLIITIIITPQIIQNKINIQKSAEETKSMTIKKGKDIVTEWVRTIGGNSVDSVNDMKQTQDGCYVIVGGRAIQQRYI